MSYVPTNDTLHLPHVVEDINGNILVMTYNWMKAQDFRKYQEAFLIIRLADEDDVASFMRRLGDC